MPRILHSGEWAIMTTANCISISLSRSRGHHEAAWRHPKILESCRLTDISTPWEMTQKAEAGLFPISIFLARRAGTSGTTVQDHRRSNWLEADHDARSARHGRTKRIGLIATALDHLHRGLTIWRGSLGSLDPHQPRPPSAGTIVTTLVAAGRR